VEEAVQRDLVKDKELKPAREFMIEALDWIKAKVN
jgi:hypothetical protein